MKNKLFAIFLAVGFLALVPSAKAQTVAITGPLSFLSKAKHTLLSGTGIVLDFTEEYIAKPVITADSFVDRLNGEDPNAIAQAKFAKAQAKKAAKAAAKAAKLHKS